MNELIETIYRIWPEQDGWHWVVENLDINNGIVISYKEHGREFDPRDRLEIPADPEVLLALGEAIIAKAKEIQGRMENKE